MAAYLDLAGFKALSIQPSSRIDEVEANDAGWVDAQLLHWSRWIDARLKKRYAVPFAAPYPEAVTGWLARIVTLRVALKGGIDALDGQYQTLVDDEVSAKAEIKEAADADEGLFELPLTTAGGQGVARVNPISYHEASPYTFTDVQSDQGKIDDGNRTGKRY